MKTCGNQSCRSILPEEATQCPHCGRLMQAGEASALNMNLADQVQRANRQRSQENQLKNEWQRRQLVHRVDGIADSTVEKAREVLGKLL